MTSIADLRKSYEWAELSEDASHADPLEQFKQWLQEAIASDVTEPNAMTLATVSINLRPSTRVVLIKGYDERIAFICCAAMLTEANSATRRR